METAKNNSLMIKNRIKMLKIIVIDVFSIEIKNINRINGIFNE
ncbi:hypothetical protein MCR_1121 [Moraxella catarrhalis BBH18]|nr:hypothetical protein MCR_1121 [Moraxella catarrhalis BBH18]